MRSSKLQKTKLFIVLLAVLIIIVGIIKSSTPNPKKVPPKVNNGMIDLRNWDFNKDGMIKLDGNWEYYDKQLLSPSDFGNASVKEGKYANIPGSYGSHGYGTYRLKILVNDKDSFYGLKIDFVQSAYRVWINNKEIMSV